MKALIGILLVSLLTYANEIEVSAQEFIGDEKNKLTYLKGNVEIKRGGDHLIANEAFVYLDTNNRPSKIQAISNVRFWLKLKDGRNIEGESNEAIFLPNMQEYQLLGNAIVREIDKNNIVRGDKIIVRHAEGYISVIGNEKKPARLIFKIEKE